VWSYGFTVPGPVRRLAAALLVATILQHGAIADDTSTDTKNPSTQRATFGVTSRPIVLKQWPSVDAFMTSGDRACVDRLKGQAIRTDVRAATVLAVQSLAAHINWDRCRRPPLADPSNRQTSPRSAGSLPELYWGSDCLENGTGRFGPTARRHALDNGVAHVVGRALWAMLLAEETMGISAPAEPLDVLSRYCHELYDNPDHLGAFIDPDNGFRRSVVCHDQREGLLGLLAVARVRRDPWAAEELKRVLATLEKITDADGHLSVERAKAAGIIAPILGTGNDATTCGRLVEPLVEYYRFSGNERALHLAKRYAQATLQSTFQPDGRFRDVAHSGGHIHSITSSLCGMFRYALVAGDRPMLDRCRRALDVGVAEYASSWGWVDEVMPQHPANEIGRGEINQTGDVIRSALLLGAAGNPKYYELAERYVRSGLLPIQHRAEDLGRFLKPNLSPSGDWERDVPARVVGGYSMFLPNDRMRPGAWPLTTQDIISGGVHALCEVWRHRCTVGADAVQLNLLFDYEGPDLTVRSGLPLEGQISLRLKTGKPVRMRIPGWVDTRTLELIVDVKRQPSTITGGYLTVVAAPGAEATVRFAVPCRVQKELVDGTLYTTTWAGNQVIEICPRGSVSPLPF